MVYVSYEDVILSGLSNFGDKEILVASHQKFEERRNVKFITDICSEILKLKESEGKNICPFGGVNLADSFIRENIVDEYIIATIPTILGNGRRLFKSGYPRTDLHLDNYSVNDGRTAVTYSKKNK